MDPSSAAPGPGTVPSEATASSEKGPPRSRWAELFAVSLTVGLVWLLLRGLDPEMVKDFVRGTDPRLLVASFGIYAATYLARAKRWQVLLNRPEIRFNELLVISSVHILFNNLMPSRTGELSYVYLLRKKKGLRKTEAAVCLVLSRVLDLISLAFIFLTSIVTLLGSEQVAGFAKLEWVAGISMVVLVVILARLPTLARFGDRWIGGPPGRRATGLRGKIGERTATVAHTIERTASPSIYLRASVLSMVIWYGKFAAFTFMVHAMPVGEIAESMSFWKVVIGSTAAELTSITPFHGLAGLGTYEMAWTGVFVILLGVPSEIARLSGFGVHILILLYSILLGGLAYLWLRRMPAHTGELL